MPAPLWRRPLSLWPVVYVSKLDLGAKASGVYRAGRIEWERDGHGPELPRECMVECDGKGEIADALSDNYGWLVATFVVLDSPVDPSRLHMRDTLLKCG